MQPGLKNLVDNGTVVSGAIFRVTIFVSTLLVGQLNSNRMAKSDTDYSSNYTRQNRGIIEKYHSWYYRTAVVL